MSTATVIRRRLEFDAAHKVLGHEGKCANLHGHRYVAEITCFAKSGLDHIGRVIDFSVIKQVVGTWIDDNWDHTTILCQEDPLVRVLESDAGMQHGFPNKVPYLMPNNPTAENMAEHLHRIASNLLAKYGIYVDSVCLYETPNCSATYIHE